MKSYEENLQEAADDFLKDGDESDFWKEVSDVQDIQKSQEATEEHSMILGNVSRITSTATKNKKASAALKEQNKLESVPFWREYNEAKAMSSSALEFCERTSFLNNRPTKIVVRSVVGASGVAHMLFSIPFVLELQGA